MLGGPTSHIVTTWNTWNCSFDPDDAPLHRFSINWVFVLIDFIIHYFPWKCVFIVNFNYWLSTFEKCAFKTLSLIIWLIDLFWFKYPFLETLAEGRSKVKDAKTNNVPVVEKEFLAGVKTEGVVSMIKQHTISEWGHEVEEKIQKARAASEAVNLKSGGKCLSIVTVIIYH